jgi:hypothetical protein
MHYRSIVPADNAAFQAYALGWWGHQPNPNGNWTESEHGRQWDSTPWFEQNNDIENRPNGEIYVEASAAEIQGYVDTILARYFPEGRPPEPSPAPATATPVPSATPPGPGPAPAPNRVFLPLLGASRAGTVLEDFAGMGASPVTRPAHSPSTIARPSSLRPSSMKNAMASSSDATTIPTLSIRLTVMAPPDRTTRSAEVLFRALPNGVDHCLTHPYSRT